MGGGPPRGQGGTRGHVRAGSACECARGGGAGVKTSTSRPPVPFGEILDARSFCDSGTPSLRAPEPGGPEGQSGPRVIRTPSDCPPPQPTLVLPTTAPHTARLRAHSPDTPPPSPAQPGAAAAAPSSHLSHPPLPHPLSRREVATRCSLVVAVAMGAVAAAGAMTADENMAGECVLARRHPIVGQLTGTLVFRQQRLDRSWTECTTLCT